jgi:gas vesicle protein
MKDQAKIIAALLVGAAAGAALGLLLAPEKGEELRGDIADYVNDLVDAAKNKAQTTADNLKEYGSNAVGSVKSKYNDLVGEAGKVVDSARGTAEDVASNAKEYAQNGAGEAKAKVKSTADDWNNSIQGA